MQSRLYLPCSNTRNFLQSKGQIIATTNQTKMKMQKNSQRLSMSWNRAQARFASTATLYILSRKIIRSVSKIFGVEKKRQDSLLFFLPRHGTKVYPSSYPLAASARNLAVPLHSTFPSSTHIDPLGTFGLGCTLPWPELEGYSISTLHPGELIDQILAARATGARIPPVFPGTARQERETHGTCAVTNSYRTRYKLLVHYNRIYSEPHYFLKLKRSQKWITPSRWIKF